MQAVEVSIRRAEALIDAVDALEDEAEAARTTRQHIGVDAGDQRLGKVGAGSA